MATMIFDLPDEEYCPLCCEEYDLTDKSFEPCACGYRICIWCWHHITTHENKLCPNCRRVYSRKGAKAYVEVPQEVVDAHHARIQKRKDDKINAKKEKNAAFKAAQEERDKLAEFRVVQRNLVFIVGLPPILCKEELLKRTEYFGQYGKVHKIYVGRQNDKASLPPLAPGEKREPTMFVYVTFLRNDDALACIYSMDGIHVDGRQIKAMFGTTKFCSTFLHNQECLNEECLFLHHMPDKEDMFTKEDTLTNGRSAFQQARVTGPNNASIFITSSDKGFAEFPAPPSRAKGGKSISVSIPAAPSQNVWKVPTPSPVVVTPGLKSADDWPISMDGTSKPPAKEAKEKSSDKESKSFLSSVPITPVSILPSSATWASSGSSSGHTPNPLSASSSKNPVSASSSNASLLGALQQSQASIEAVESKRILQRPSSVAASSQQPAEEPAVPKGWRSVTPPNIPSAPASSSSSSRNSTSPPTSRAPSLPPGAYAPYNAKKDEPIASTPSTPSKQQPAPVSAPHTPSRRVEPPPHRPYIPPSSATKQQASSVSPPKQHPASSSSIVDDMDPLIHSVLGMTAEDDDFSVVASKPLLVPDNLDISDSYMASASRHQSRFGFVSNSADSAMSASQYLQQQHQQQVAQQQHQPQPFQQSAQLSQTLASLFEASSLRSQVGSSLTSVQASALEASLQPQSSSKQPPSSSPAAAAATPSSVQDLFALFGSSSSTPASDPSSFLQPQAMHIPYQQQQPAGYYGNPYAPPFYSHPQYQQAAAAAAAAYMPYSFMPHPYGNIFGSNPMMPQTMPQKHPMSEEDLLKSMRSSSSAASAPGTPFSPYPYQASASPMSSASIMNAFGFNAGIPQAAQQPQTPSSQRPNLSLQTPASIDTFQFMSNVVNSPSNSPSASSSPSAYPNGMGPAIPASRGEPLYAVNVAGRQQIDPTAASPHVPSVDDSTKKSADPKLSKAAAKEAAKIAKQQQKEALLQAQREKKEQKEREKEERRQARLAEQAVFEEARKAAVAAAIAEQERLEAEAAKMTQEQLQHPQQQQEQQQLISEPVSHSFALPSSLSSTMPPPSIEQLPDGSTVFSVDISEAISGLADSKNSKAKKGKKADPKKKKFEEQKGAALFASTLGQISAALQQQQVSPSPNVAASSSVPFSSKQQPSVSIKRGGKAVSVASGFGSAGLSALGAYFGDILAEASGHLQRQVEVDVLDERGQNMSLRIEVLPHAPGGAKDAKAAHGKNQIKSSLSEGNATTATMTFQLPANASSLAEKMGSVSEYSEVLTQMTKKAAKILANGGSSAKSGGSGIAGLFDSSDLASLQQEILSAISQSQDGNPSSPAASADVSFSQSFKPGTALASLGIISSPSPAAQPRHGLAAAVETLEREKEQTKKHIEHLEGRLQQAKEKSRQIE